VRRRKSRAAQGEGGEGTDGREQRELAGGLGPPLDVGRHRCVGEPLVAARGVALAPAARASLFIAWLNNLPRGA